VGCHMGIHTAFYNYFATHVSSALPPPSQPTEGASAPTLSRGSSAMLRLGHDIHDRLGKYFKDVARKPLLGTLLDDSTLVPYLVGCFIY